MLLLHFIGTHTRNLLIRGLICLDTSPLSYKSENGFLAEWDCIW